MDAKEVRSQLSGHPLFEGFSEEQLDCIARAGHLAGLGEGEPLIQEGEESHAMYILLSGSVAVTKRGSHEEHELARIEADAILGELGLLLPHPRSASVRATSSGTYFELSRDAFNEMLDSDDRVARLAGRQLFASLARTMGERQRETNERLVALLEEGERHQRVDLSDLKRRFGRTLSYHL